MPSEPRAGLALAEYEAIIDDERGARPSEAMLLDELRRMRKQARLWRALYEASDAAYLQLVRAVRAACDG